MSLYHAKWSYWKFSTRIDCKYSNKKKKKNSNTPKLASCGNLQNHKHGQKAKKEAPSRPHKGYNLANAKMVPREGSHQHVNINVKKILPNVQIGQIVNFNK